MTGLQSYTNMLELTMKRNEVEEEVIPLDKPIVIVYG